MEITPQEKQRLLRERRQAKMAKGNALQRLNSILALSPLVKAPEAVSVLDKPKAPETSAVEVTEIEKPAMVYEDPEVPDISTLLPETQTLDDVFQKVFGQNEQPELLSQMMGAAPPGQAPPEPQLHLVYEHRRVLVYFLVLRFFVHTLNFVYHHRSLEGFAAARTRLAPADARWFFVWFVTTEVVVISAYFAVLVQKRLLRLHLQTHFLLLMLSLVLSIAPGAARYRSVVDDVLVYWEGASILIGDVSLLVVLFGLSSVL